MNLTSSTHRLALTESTGEFEVYPLQERQLHVREIRDGQIVRDGVVTDPDPAMRRLLEQANRRPLFACNYAGDGCFNLDVDCGFQRWHGVKCEKDVRVALRRCGLTLRQARTVIAASKVEEHDWLGRCA